MINLIMYSYWLKLAPNEYPFYLKCTRWFGFFILMLRHEFNLTSWKQMIGQLQLKYSFEFVFLTFLMQFIQHLLNGKQDLSELN